MTEATWNPDDVHTQSGRVCVFADGNRTITNSPFQMGSSTGIAFSDIWIPQRKQEKLYCEFEVVDDGVNEAVNAWIGLCSTRHGVGTTFPNAAGGGGLHLLSSGGSAVSSEGVDILLSLPNFQIGDVAMMAIDGSDHNLNFFQQAGMYECLEEIVDDDGTIWQEAMTDIQLSMVPVGVGLLRVWFGKNGTWFANGGVGDPATGANPTWASNAANAITRASDALLCTAANVWGAVLSSGLKCRFLQSQQQYPIPAGYRAFDHYVKPSRARGFNWALHTVGQKRYPYQSPNAWRRGGEPSEASPGWNTLTADRSRNSGKRYFECEVMGTDTVTRWGNYCWVGLLTAPFFAGSAGTGTDNPGFKASTYGCGIGDSTATDFPTSSKCYENNVLRYSLQTYGANKTDRMRVRCAVDFDANKVFFGINHEWFNNGDPAAGIGWINSGSLYGGGILYPAVGLFGSMIAELALAQDDFEFPIPDGYSAWGGEVNEASYSEHVSIGGPIEASLVADAAIAEAMRLDDAIDNSAAMFSGWSDELRLSAVKLASMIVDASLDERLALEDALASNAIFMAGYGEQVIIAHGVDLGADQIAAWCITLADRPGEQESAPAYRYDHYGFDSFVEIDGQLHGLGEEGLFAIGGEDDDGEQILATAVLPRQPLGTDSNHRVQMMLVRGKSANNITVRFIDADGSEYDYETEFPCGNRSNLRRVKVGRGWSESEYSIVLENQDGAYAEIYDLMAVPLKLTRRRGGEE